MGFWGDVGKSVDRILENSELNWKFQCPNCQKVTNVMGWLDFPSNRRAREWYREKAVGQCDYCGYKFGIDPDSAYVRLPDNELFHLGEKVEGVWNHNNFMFVIQHHEDTDIYFRCPCINTTHNQYRKMSRSDFFTVARSQIGPFMCEFGMRKMYFLPHELLELQLPNLVDRLETAVLPQSVFRQLEREMEAQRKNQLSRLGYSEVQRVSGRRVACRRLTIKSDAVIVEEVVYEEFEGFH